MIITPVKEKVSVSGVSETQAFSIKESAHSFEVLSNALYKNPILAMIRELICNARDSHIESGVDLPVEVSLPTNLKPELVIKDQGLGLSRESVMRMYSTYFESSKTENNSLIGGFGLGSKSPFAYTKGFSVASVYNGKEGFYAAFKSEDGLPQISCLAEIDTEKRNGVTITIPVQEKDFSNFRDTTRKFLCTFDYPVILDGTKYIARELKDEFGLYNVDSGNVLHYGGGAFVRMAGVCYPVPEVPELQFLLNECKQKYSKHIFDFNIGELDVQPSREGLRETKRTIAAIASRGEKIVRVAKKNVEESLANCKTDMARLIALSKITGSLFSSSMISNERSKIVSAFVRKVQALRTIQESPEQTRMKELGCELYYYTRNGYRSVQRHDPSAAEVPLTRTTVEFPVVVFDKKANLKDITKHSCFFAIRPLKGSKVFEYQKVIDEFLLGTTAVTLTSSLVSTVATKERSVGFISYDAGREYPRSTKEKLQENGFKFYVLHGELSKKQMLSLSFFHKFFVLSNVKEKKLDGFEDLIEFYRKKTKETKFRMDDVSSSTKKAAELIDDADINEYLNLPKVSWRLVDCFVTMGDLRFTYAEKPEKVSEVSSLLTIYNVEKTVQIFKFSQTIKD